MAHVKNAILHAKALCRDSNLHLAGDRGVHYYFIYYAAPFHHFIPFLSLGVVLTTELATTDHGYLAYDDDLLGDDRQTTCSKLMSLSSESKSVLSEMT